MDGGKKSICWPESAGTLHDGQRAGGGVSETAGQRFIPEKDSPGVVSRKFSVYELVEDTRYRIIQGYSPAAKGGRTGQRGTVMLSYIWIRDRFSCPCPMAWAAVKKAKAESELMINLLEQMVDIRICKALGAEDD